MYDNVAICGAAGTKVRGLGTHGVISCMMQILDSSLVPNHGSIAGADAISGGTGAVGTANNALSAGSDDQIALGHKSFGHNTVDLAGMSKALYQILRSANSCQTFTHQVNSLLAGALRTRMGAENDGVTGLQRVDSVAGGRKVRIGRRNDAGDNANGLRVDLDLALRHLSDAANRLLAQAVTKDTADLKSLVLTADGIAEAALLDAKLDQLMEGLGVGNLLGDGPDGSVDIFLSPFFELKLRFVSTLETGFDIGDLRRALLRIRFRADKEVFRRYDLLIVRIKKQGGKPCFFIAVNYSPYTSLHLFSRYSM